MGLKDLLEEHRKIYLWQNKSFNEYPYAHGLYSSAVSISNEISSYKVVDIEKFVLLVLTSLGGLGISIPEGFMLV